MLQLFKNNVVTSATKDQAELRQRELDFYTNNFWIWGNTSTMMAGFVFAQLTNPVPVGTDFWLETYYLVFTSVCLGLNLVVITWTVLCCMWAPGLALRGPNGMRSFHEAIDYLRGENYSIYLAFNISVVFYFLSSCCILWVYPSKYEVNVACSIVLGLFLIIIVILQIQLEYRIGGTVSSHEGEDGRIAAFTGFEGVADLDTHLARVAPEFSQAGSGYAGTFSGAFSGMAASSSN
jgi:hypothetical protein